MAKWISKFCIYLSNLFIYTRILIFTPWVVRELTQKFLHGFLCNLEVSLRFFSFWLFSKHSLAHILHSFTNEFKVSDRVRCGLQLRFECTKIRSVPACHAEYEVRVNLKEVMLLFWLFLNRALSYITDQSLKSLVILIIVVFIQ